MRGIDDPLGASTRLAPMGNELSTGDREHPRSKSVLVSRERRESVCGRQPDFLREVLTGTGGLRAQEAHERRIQVAVEMPNCGFVSRLGRDEQRVEVGADHRSSALRRCSTSMPSDPACSRTGAATFAHGARVRLRFFGPEAPTLMSAFVDEIAGDRAKALYDLAAGSVGGASVLR